MEPGRTRASNWLLRAQGRPDAGDHRQGDRQAARRSSASTPTSRPRMAMRHRAHRRQGEEPRRRDASTRPAPATGERAPWFCSGCPHNTSTKVPEGLARGGRHRLPLHGGLDGPLDRHLQPDGRRRRAVGRPGAVHDRQAHLRQPRRRHLLPLGPARDPPERSPPSVNITYKILFNDAVAMTGGQPVDGTMTRCREMTRELDAEGVAKVVVVTDEPEKYDGTDPRALAPASRCTTATSSTRSRRELREIPGCTVIIYDQTCATEKRRRRKRGTMADPDQARRHQRAGLRRLRRLLGAEQLPVGRAGRDRVRPQAPHQPEHLQQGLLVPEGLLPELRHRRRRAAEEARRRQRRAAATCAACRAARAGAAARRDSAWGIVVAGVGGTGVITIGQLLGMAAHLEGKGVVTQDAGRPGAEGRRDLEPHPDREPAGGDLHDQGRHREGRPRDRLRPDRRREQGDAGGDARRPHLRRAQHARDADRGVRQQPRLAVPGRQLRSGDRRRGRARPRRRRRRRHARRAAARRLDLHQPADARLRLAAGPRAAVARGADARDRAERRAGRQQQGRVRMGPPRRARPAGR